MDALWQDLRYSARLLRRSPGFASIAILSLALGIGANSTIFSVIHTYILRPLPYRDPERLVLLWESYPSKGGIRNTATVANFLDWSRAATSFERMGMYADSGDPMTILAGGPAERVNRQLITPELFQLLGVAPVLGRSFTVEDARQGGRTLVLSDGFWRRRFGADPGVVGRTVTVPGGNVLTILGVMPPGFRIGWRATDVWQPMDFDNPNAVNRTVHWLMAAGRLKPGVNLTQAQGEMTAIARQLEQAYPETNQGWTVFLESFQDEFIGEMKVVLYPLFGAVGFVLLIACSNVANLLLARATIRRREIALRAALGASRWRTVRQLLVDGLLIALPGGLLGLLLAVWGIDAFRAVVPPMPNLHLITINRAVLLFTLGVSLFTGLILGLVPALHAASPDLSESLKSGGRQVTAGNGRLRSLLVVSEVALALVLLIGAGLMIHTVLRVLGVRPGFDPRNVLTLQLNLSGARYVQTAPKREIDMRNISPRAGEFFQQVLDGARAVPGVESAALVAWLPSRGWRPRNFTIAGRPAPAPGERPHAAYNLVSSDYFETMRIAHRQGRTFTDRDSESSPWVAVINESLARRYFPDEDPIGKLITMDVVREERPRQIIGVVGDVRQRGPTGEVQPEIYVSFRQQPEAYPGDGAQTRLRMTLVLRSPSDLASLTSSVRRLVAQLDPDQPVFGEVTMEKVIANQSAEERAYMVLLGAFALLALVLAAIGIYGVMTYLVNERTHEIGIRMALGAGRAEVLRLVLGHGLKLTAAGMTLGLLASIGLTRVIAGFLFGITPTDPVTFAVVSLLLFAVAFLAVWRPARRAARTDPMLALHHD